VTPADASLWPFDLILWPIVLPLIGATLTFVLPRLAVPLGVSTAFVTLLSVAALLLEVWAVGAESYAIGGWAAPLGIALYADGLSVVMLLMAGAVGALISVYAAGYFKLGALDIAIFWPLWLFLWAALNAIFLSNDIFNLYVGLELMGISAVGLVVVAGGRTAVVAGTRYLLVSLIGSLAYLLGVALLYGAFGTLDLNTLAASLAPVPAAWAAVALITVGMALKTALFPLHFWLPPTHASAPAPVSALLSGLVAKASFYLLLRLWFSVFPAALTPAVVHVIGLMGALGILWGSALALRQSRLKLLIAYSTVAQIGYLFVLFPLAGPSGWGSDAWSGGVIQAFSHAFAKAAMFLSAGTLAYAVGDDGIDSLGGVTRHLPLSVLAFGLAGVSLIGLPPSGGFTAKWLLLLAAFGSGQWWHALAILVGSLLAAGYVFRVVQVALGAGQERAARLAPRRLEVASLTLALIALLLGFASAPLLQLLNIGVPA
jgi:multicomponent Na+:H+ antiporter subunit D